MRESGKLAYSRVLGRRISWRSAFAHTATVMSLVITNLAQLSPCHRQDVVAVSGAGEVLT